MPRENYGGNELTLSATMVNREHHPALVDANVPADSDTSNADVSSQVFTPARTTPGYTADQGCALEAVELQTEKSTYLVRRHSALVSHGDSDLAMYIGHGCRHGESTRHR